MIVLTQWHFSPSYKFDLANICNMFTGNEEYQKYHSQAWEEFKHLFSEPQFQRIANMLVEQGFMVSSALIAIFDSYDYNGDKIDEICKVAEDPELRETILRSYFVDSKLLSQQQWGQYGPMIPHFSAMARNIHQGGFAEYWQQNSLPEIKQRCQDFIALADKYPVLKIDRIR